MTTERSVEQIRRLERQLVTLRWLVAAFGAVQVGFAIRDHAADPAFVLPLGSALVVGLTVGNLAISNAARRAPTARQLDAIGLTAFVLDAVVILTLVWLSTSGPADPVWVVGYLLPLEGAARWGLPGALVGAALFVGGETFREFDLATRFRGHEVDGPALAFRGGMAVVVAAVAGQFASSLRREAALVAERAREAEAARLRAEESARRERQARAEVAAFHAATIAEAESEDRSRTLQETADAIARELECSALALLVRRRGIVGETEIVAAGVFGDPGYLRDETLHPASHPIAAAIEEGTPAMDTRDAVAPMHVRGRIVGALHERRPEGDPPDDDRLLLLSRLADQLGLVLETARLRQDQEETVRRLRELDEMKTDFVAITSHELRTPLSGIRGFVDMLRRRGEDLSDEERAEFLDVVLMQTDRLIRLVEDLLVVSRVEAGALTLAPDDVEVKTFLHQLVRALGDGSSRVEIVAGPEAPAQIVVDPQRLAQILTNLVHNALKFSRPESGVELAWDAPAVGTVSFAVTDLGDGIPDDELKRIFERFHQAEPSIAHTEGFGLGLYITKLLTEAMGGWIDVRSQAGVGSTFCITLPASRTLPGPARPSGARRPG